MVGDAIKSILSSIEAPVSPLFVPHRRGSRWITYTMISDVPVHTKDGACNYDQYRFQMDMYARTYADADTLAASVRTALDNYSGTVESVVIDQIYYDGQFRNFEFLGEAGEEEDYFRVSQDYIIEVKS